jgi:hypothetical protein
MRSVPLVARHLREGEGSATSVREKVRLAHIGVATSDALPNEFDETRLVG